MKLKAVLFDLDGTLLPMDQEEFVKAYFGRLAKFMAPYGYEAKALTDAIWTSTGSMVKNDGSQTNEAAFWQTFCRIFGKDAMKDEPLFDQFYRQEFPKVRSVCGYTPKAAETVDMLKRAGICMALATNPIFPAIATEERIAWAGISPQDFACYTTYENFCYSKPNPHYYEAILERLQLEPAQCMMVGNDLGEDMVARELGMDVFLLTDHLIAPEDADLSAYPHGDFHALQAYLKERFCL